MMEFKPVYRNAILVARAALPQEAEALSVELDSLPPTAWGESVHPGIDRLGGKHGVIKITGAESFVGAPLFDGLPTLGRLATLPLFASKNRIAVLRQNPGQQQRLHPDGEVTLPTYVLHMSPGGKFDYKPDPQGITLSIDVGVGDIVKMCDRIRHRGGNPGPRRRYTAVFYTQPRDL